MRIKKNSPAEALRDYFFKGKLLLCFSLVKDLVHILPEAIL